MRESWLRCSAVGLAILGTLLLAWFAFTEEPEQVPVWKVSGKMVGLRISTSGLLTSVFIKDHTAFFTLQDGRKIKGVLFGVSAEEARVLQEGEIVEVRGKVEEKEGELQVVTDRVKGVA